MAEVSAAATVVLVFAGETCGVVEEEEDENCTSEELRTVAVERFTLLDVEFGVAFVEARDVVESVTIEVRDVAEAETV